MGRKDLRPAGRTATWTESRPPLANGKQDFETAEPQLTTPAPNVGSHDKILASGLAATTVVPFWTTAHARTDAPIFDWSSLIGVTELFLSWRVPTLFAGIEKAA